MTDMPPPPPSRDLPFGVHDALRARVLEGTYEEARSRRRWLLPAAAAAAVLVVVFGAIGVLRGGTSRPAPVASDPVAPSSASPSAFSSAPPPANPATFDPLWTRLTPGWLPEGYPITSRFGVRSEEALRVGGYAEPFITIAITPRAVKPPLPGQLEGTTTPGPAINGVPSTWFEQANRQTDSLQWEWADGARASVHLVGFPRDSESNARLAARIAEGLRPQSPRPVALPFTMERPAHAWVIDARSSRRGETYTARLVFGPSAGSVQATEVTWTPDVYATERYPANARVNGREASLRTDGAYEVVQQAFDRNIAEVRCQVKPGAPRQEARDECVRTAAGLAPFGSIAAPSSWSTHPVR